MWDCYWQGWEFSVFYQIARFLRKNEQMSDSLKNEQFTCHSFLVSDLSDSLTKRGNERIVHFLNNKNILKL